MIDDSVNYTLRHVGPRWRTKVSFDPRSAITKAVSARGPMFGPSFGVVDQQYSHEAPGQWSEQGETKTAGSGTKKHKVRCQRRRS